MATQPGIVISRTDMQRLERLLESLPARDHPGRAGLQAELDRADVVEPADMPPSVVTMNSTVRFRIASSAEEFRMTLVYPRDADTSGTTLSVLAPVGSAVLGLSENDEIEWPKPGGGTLKVLIAEVVHQPERAGEIHR